MSIEVYGLVKYFGKKCAVNNVSFSITDNEVVGLLGPNGAGKSTIFYMIVGFLKPDNGTIFLDNSDISRQPMYKRARLGIGYLPQQSSIFRKMTVEDNISSILEMKKDLTKKERQQRLEELLEELNIKSIRKQYGQTLSGGERRRVEIARALVNKPKFLLLDEPFAGVDPIAVKDIHDIIHSIRQKGIGVLITDHNVRETLKITHRSYIINHGTILVQGDTNALINDESARKIYLGEDFYL